MITPLYLCLIALSLGKGQPEPEIARDIIVLSNEYRESKKLDLLRENEYLNQLALQHSEDMAEKRTRFGHGGFNKRAKKAGKKYKIAGFAENVFYCEESCDAKAAVEGWIDSPGHRKNLQGDYTHIGTGVYTDKNGTRYFTQLFASIEE